LKNAVGKSGALKNIFNRQGALRNVRGVLEQRHIARQSRRCREPKHLARMENSWHDRQDRTHRFRSE